MRRYVFSVFTAWIVIISVALALPRPAQSVTQTSSVTGSPVLSPSVLSTYIGRRVAAEGWKIDVLVLWRGAPGWHSNGPRHDSAGGGAAFGTSAVWEQGDLRLTVSIGKEEGVVEVQGRRVKLHGGNVVLVDHADSPASLTVVGVESIDGTYVVPAGQRPGPIRLDEIVAKYPRLLDYLRCDVPYPNPQMQAVWAKHGCPVGVGVVR
jgi:hypothetical protein